MQRSVYILTILMPMCLAGTMLQALPYGLEGGLDRGGRWQGTTGCSKSKCGADRSGGYFLSDMFDHCMSPKRDFADCLDRAFYFQRSYRIYICRYCFYTASA